MTTLQVITLRHATVHRNRWGELLCSDNRCECNQLYLLCVVILTLHNSYVTGLQLVAVTEGERVYSRGPLISFSAGAVDTNLTTDI